MHPPSASAKWISPFPATTRRFEVARASPEPAAHEGGPRPTRNSYFSVTAPSPGTRPEPLRAAHSLAPGGGEQAPRIEFNFSSAVRASCPVANSDAPLAAVPAAPSRTTSPAKTTTVRSSRIPPVPFIFDLQFRSSRSSLPSVMGALPVADQRTEHVGLVSAPLAAVKIGADEVTCEEKLS